MNLIFSITNQHITRTDSEIVVADSRNYLNATFSFSSDWDDVAAKTAVFKHGEEAYTVILNNNACLVPHEVIKSGHFNVSVFGGNRITVDIARVDVYPSGYEEGQTPEDPTPSVYEQIIEDLEARPEVAVNEPLQGGEHDATSIRVGEELFKIPTGGSGGNAEWGNIGGTLSNQTDLASALSELDTELKAYVDEAIGGALDADY